MGTRASAEVKCLTIREHFAGIAMAGLLAMPETRTSFEVDKLTAAAVVFADSLIAALGQGQDGSERAGGTK